MQRHIQKVLVERMVESGGKSPVGSRSTAPCGAFGGKSWTLLHIWQSILTAISHINVLNMRKISWRYHDAISEVRITRGIVAYFKSFWMRIFSSSRAWLACSAAATRTSSSLRCFRHDSRLALWQTVPFCTGTSCFPVSNGSPVCALGIAGRALNFDGNDCDNLEQQQQQH